MSNFDYVSIVFLFMLLGWCIGNNHRMTERNINVARRDLQAVKETLRRIEEHDVVIRELIWHHVGEPSIEEMVDAQTGIPSRPMLGLTEEEFRKLQEELKND